METYTSTWSKDNILQTCLINMRAYNSIHGKIKFKVYSFKIEQF